MFILQKKWSAAEKLSQWKERDSQTRSYFSPSNKRKTSLSPHSLPKTTKTDPKTVHIILPRVAFVRADVAWANRTHKNLPPTGKKSDNSRGQWQREREKEKKKNVSYVRLFFSAGDTYALTFLHFRRLFAPLLERTQRYKVFHSLGERKKRGRARVLL